MSQVLIVEDEPAICWSLEQALKAAGHDVATASSVEQVWKKRSKTQPDAIVLDVRLPGQDGLTALPEFQRQFPNTPIIIMTAFGDLPTTVTALQGGAFEYLNKPFELARFVQILEEALARRESPVLTPMTPVAADVLVGRSAAMQQVFRQIALVAPTPFPVLITGETGTGKELVARAVHAHSGSPEGPFVGASLAALSPTVIESELFGHVRGAFTGAHETRPGLLDLAHGGTLFLDELGDAPLSTQVKLLRVLETGRFSPVGSTVERSLEARLVAATHRDLRTMIQAGSFREDLFHRLNVFAIALPTLRARMDDVRPLVELFLQRMDSALHPAGVSEEFWQEIQRRPWMGNVRELRHAIDYAVVVARQGVLRPDHLPTPTANPTADDTSGVGNTSTKIPATSDLEQAVARWTREVLSLRGEEAVDLHMELVQAVEIPLFREVLQATQQNRTAAARRLGLDRATLRTRLREARSDDSST